MRLICNRSGRSYHREGCYRARASAWSPAVPTDTGYALLGRAPCEDCRPPACAAELRCLQCGRLYWADARRLHPWIPRPGAGRTPRERCPVCRLWSLAPTGQIAWAEGLELLLAVL